MGTTQVTGYVVVNRATQRASHFKVAIPGDAESQSKARRRAYRAADKADLAYGAICCVVRIEQTTTYPTHSFTETV